MKLTGSLVVAAGLALGLMGWSPGVRAAEAPAVYRVYVGTYTGQGSEGIYRSELDLETGKLSAPVLAGAAQNPSFLAIHPDGKKIYAASEVGGGQVLAFAIEADGSLKALNAESAKGAGPCHLNVAPSGKHVLVANYGSGSCAVLPIDAEGRVGPATGFQQHAGSGANPQRQKEPHAHSINLAPDGRFAFVADLGLDKIQIYRFDAKKGTIEPNDPPFGKVAPGGGPRHFAFRPDAKFAYTNNELTSSVTAFAYDKTRGALTEIQTLSTLPEGMDAAALKNSTAEIRVHPNGKFLYISNRGHDSLAIFRIDASTGKLASAGHASSGGKTPRHFNIDPTGRYLLAANQNSGNVVVFGINPETGALTPTGSEIQVSRAVCVRFLEKN